MPGGRAALNNDNPREVQGFAVTNDPEDEHTVGMDRPAPDRPGAPAHSEMAIEDLSRGRGRGVSRDAPERSESYPVSRGGPMRFNRITVEPDKMGGVPCIRGLSASRSG